MARLTLQPIQLRTFPAPHITGQRVRVALLHNEEALAEGCGAVSIPDIKVRRLTSELQRVGNHYFRTFTVMLEDGEHLKLPPLPKGWAIEEVEDMRSENPDAKVFTVGLDTRMVEEVIREALLEHEVCYFEDHVTEVGKTFFITYKRLAENLMAVTLDADNDDDRRVHFNIFEPAQNPLDNVGIIRSAYSYLHRRPVGYEWSLASKVGCDLGIPALMAHWQTQSMENAHNLPGFDAAFESKPMNVARRAFGLQLKTGPVADTKHVYRHRQLGLDVDERTPFPETTQFKGFCRDGGPELLVLNTTRSGHYARPVNLDTSEHVFIHREEGAHRFIFWDRIDWVIRVGFTAPMVALIPVMVPDEECAKQMPTSPMRGMDPQITRAVATNPYFASALQHAFNRRKFLHSLMQWGGRPTLYSDQPIMIRSPENVIVRGDKNSKVGRRIARDLSYRARVTIERLIAPLSPNELEFSTVQPVAPVERERRAICLDL